jgi:hypothetical protein
LGTGSVGDTTPAERAERTGMLSGYLLAVTMQAGNGLRRSREVDPARGVRRGRGGAPATGAAL